MSEIIDTSKEYLLFRDDVEAPEGVITIQMSKDVLAVLGDALEDNGMLDEGSMWFWEKTNTPERGIKEVPIIFTDEERDLIREWLSHSLDLDAGWLIVDKSGVDIFKRHWLTKVSRRLLKMEEVFDGDTSDHEMWKRDAVLIKKYLDELRQCN
jgi:hypothetical protein